MHACTQTQTQTHRLPPPDRKNYKKKPAAGGAEEEGKEEGKEEGRSEEVLGDETDGENSFATGVFHIFSLRE